MNQKEDSDSASLKIEKLVSNCLNVVVFGTGAIFLCVSNRRKYLDKPSLWCIGLYMLSVMINCG